MFFCRFRRLISGCLIGFGFGIMLVLILPPIVWLFITGLTVIIYGFRVFLGK